MELTAEISWVPGAKKNGRIGSFVCITRRLNSKPSYPNPCQHTWNSQTVVPDPVLLNFSDLMLAGPTPIKGLQALFYQL